MSPDVIAQVRAHDHCLQLLADGCWVVLPLDGDAQRFEAGAEYAASDDDCLVALEWL